MSAISLTSAPAAKTRSPPYTTTALTSARSLASSAAARISSWTCTMSAFILGRSSRIVPTPSSTSRRTNSPISCRLLHPGVSPAFCRASGTMAPVTPGTWRRPGETAVVWPGRTWPLGATYDAEATNFAVRAPAATRMWVCVFDDDGHETRHELTELSLGIWHGAVPGVPPGTRYGFRADGPWAPDLGLRFNVDKLLLDPYARAVSGELVEDPAIYGYDVTAPARRSRRNSAAYVPKGVVVHAPAFDWGDDRRPYSRWRDTVIYELHAVVQRGHALHVQ